MIIRKVKVTEYEYQAPINYVAGATEPDIQFQLTDYAIPAEATGRVYVGRADGTFEYTEVTIDGNTITIEPTSSMFSVKGPGALQITLTVGDEVAKNFAVPVYVHADLASDQAEHGTNIADVFSQSEQAALEQFEQDAQQIVAEVIEDIPADYTELAENVSEINEQIGDLSELETEAKTDLVSAINEVAQGGGGSGGVGVPAVVRAAIYTLLNAAMYTETGLEDEIAIVEAWADTTATAISLNESSLSMSGVTSETLTATLTPPDSTTPVVWSSSDTSVATVSSGTVTSVGNGTCTITATAGSVSATCSVTVSGIVGPQYTITNTLSHCTNSNDAVTVSGGDSYSATISADSGYTLDTVTCTMGGVSQTVTGGSISIASVTGDIVITASATQQQSNLLRNWDFTQSMTDSVASHEATLVGGATWDSSGVHITAANQIIKFGTQFGMAGKTVEIDISEMDIKFTGQHIRVLMCSNSDSKGYGALIYRNGSGYNYWSAYGPASNGTWSDPYSADLSGDSSAVKNAFSGKTVKCVFDSSGYCSLYVDGTYKGVTSISMGTSTDSNKYFRIGGLDNGSGNYCYNMTVTGVRVYKGVA